MFCVKCGQEVSVGDGFCSKCGVKITGASKQTPQQGDNSPKASLATKSKINDKYYLSLLLTNALFITTWMAEATYNFMDAVGPLGSILGSAIALTEIFVIIRTIGYERKHKYPLNSLKIILGIFLLFLLIAIVR